MELKSVMAHKTAVVAPLPGPTQNETAAATTSLPEDSPFSSTATSVAFPTFNDPLLDVPDGSLIDEITTLVSSGLPLRRLTDSKGRTPLHLMAMQCALSTMRVALSSDHVKKDDVNAKDPRGMTALMFAARNKEPYGSMMVDALILAGANVNATDAKSKTALHYAIGQPPVIEVLLAKGADPNVRCNSYGLTPLATAIVESDYISVMSITKSCNASGSLSLDLAAVDFEGLSAEQRCGPLTSSIQTFDSSVHPKMLVLIREYRKRAAAAAGRMRTYDDGSVPISFGEVSLHPYSDMRSDASDLPPAGNGRRSLYSSEGAAEHKTRH